MPRLRLTIDLTRPLPHAPSDTLARPPSPADAAALAGLMLDAYRGTIDDGGETADDAAAEIARLWAGAYGPFDAPASEIILRDGAPASATLITAYEGAPLVAFSMTRPAWQRRGLARAGLLRSLARLRDRGLPRARLAVTDGNTPAQALYAALGFTPDPV